MENLQGGTLALEHRYTLESGPNQIGFISRYVAVQSPFAVPVWVDVFDALGEVTAPEAVVERLEASAERTANLDGEGLLPVVDYGELDRHVPFFVSRRVSAPTLAERIDEETLSARQTAQLVDRLAAVLGRAHDQGVAHGHLAPRWVYLPDGTLGEAMIGQFEVGPTLGELRRMDNIVLTPEMVDAFPPEAFERPTHPSDLEDDEFDASREFTVAADTYALGVTAYICLTGEHPFFDAGSTDASDGIAQIQHEPAKPASEFGVEAQVSEVLETALIADPEDRFDTPNDFADALADATDVDRSSDSPQKTPAIDGAPSDDGAEPGQSAGRDELPDTGSDDSTAPGPASTAMTLAAALLVLSNLGWFLFWYLPESKPQRTTIRLDSHPSSAVVRRGDERGTELGTTPLSISAASEAPNPVKLYVTKPGFQGEAITISGDPETHDFAVHLTPLAERPADSDQSDSVDGGAPDATNSGDAGLQ